MVLACEDEILNTTEISLDDLKVICEKINCLIRTISLAIICLFLLVVVFISCYYYYTEHQSKQKHLLSHQDTKKQLKAININIVI